MDPITAVLLLLVAAIVLVGIEMLLPTHGVLGVVGAVSATGAVVVAFLINRWAGVGLLLTCCAAAPFVVAAMLKMWESSWIGRRLPLNTVTQPLEHERIEIGDVGTTLTALRPMGSAEFGPVTVQVIAQRGTIDAGSRVHVIDYRDGVATVAPIETTSAHSPARSPSEGIHT